MNDVVDKSCYISNSRYILEQQRACGKSHAAVPTALARTIMNDVVVSLPPGI